MSYPSTAPTANRARFWLSVGLLLLAVAVLVVVGVLIFRAVLTPSSAACHNAPSRVTRYPQLLGVGVAILGFVLGRVTARPKIRVRSQVRTWIDDGADVQAHANAALVTQGALTAALLFITCLIAFEAITLALAVWPITYYLRCASEAAPTETLFATAAFTLLAGRWLWLPTTPEESA